MTHPCLSVPRGSHPFCLIEINKSKKSIRTPRGHIQRAEKREPSINGGHGNRKMYTGVSPSGNRIKKPAPDWPKKKAQIKKFFFVNTLALVCARQRCRGLYGTKCTCCCNYVAQNMYNAVCDSLDSYAALGNMTLLHFLKRWPLIPGIESVTQRMAIASSLF